MNRLKWLNVVLRGFMETGVVLAFIYWGLHTGQNTFSKIILTIGAPVVAFGFWGLVDFHNFGKKAEYLRLIQELLISGLAAVLLYLSGLQLLAWILGILSALHHVLVYISGERLIKNKSNNKPIAPAPHQNAQ